MIEIATNLALAALALALLMVVIRIIRGPTIADRILGLDVLSMLGAAIIGVFAIRSGIFLFADIAVVAVVVGLISTVALARFLISGGSQ